MSHRAASLAAAAARTDTGYDRVIEGIIATFKTIPSGG
jgi:hypothetical protein